MKEELIDAVMDACKSESGVTFEFSKNMDDAPHLFWPTILVVVEKASASQAPEHERLYHGNIEFHLFDFFDKAKKGNSERLSVEHVVIDEESVSVEGHFDGEEFWFNVLFHPPEDAQPRGLALPDGSIVFDDGRKGHCDDDDDDKDDDEEDIDPALICDFPYAPILKDPPLALRCKKRKGHAGGHGQVV